jgi:hypothetical protein
MPHLPERLVELANIKLNRMGARAKKKCRAQGPA